ncbi:DUF4259 domain-containing protein [Microbacterium sp. P06]|uniref:DUF4259 domain-containing protein n=1 Tax=unclassified Microbacterium TaxID=2609290 RepID=UPI003744FED7
MGAWSGEPFGNELATEWAWELESAHDWRGVHAALERAASPEAPLDEDTATIALAAAEVVARGLGRPTQDDAYIEDVAAFVSRVPAPDPDLVRLAHAAIERAGDPSGSLGRVWQSCGPDAWREATDRLSLALRG